MTEERTRKEVSTVRNYIAPEIHELGGFAKETGFGIGGAQAGWWIIADIYGPNPSF